MERSGGHLMRKIQLTLILFLFIYGCATTVEQQKNNNEFMEEQIPVPKVQLSEFIVGPGDSLEIQVWLLPKRIRAIQLQINAFLSYIFVTNLKVAGMNLTD